ncbi:response regulator transcription factor [Inquilinus limosus]|uniref:LuxR C-terminal-related transcriptional regulator n=1 Tax=Inquilinus limosus TaxID=171674 RepID=UPI003F15F546
MLAYRGTATMPPPPESQAVEQTGFHDPFAETGRGMLGDEVRAASVVTIIDHRTLSRDGLVKAIEDAGAGYLVAAFASLEDWLVDRDTPQRTSIIIINIGPASEEHAHEIIDDLADLKSQYPHIGILALGDDEDTDLAVKILTSGIQGYLSSNMSVSMILGAIRLIQSGGAFIPANCLVRLYQQREAPARSKDPTDGLLTVQQTNVAQGLLRGKTNKTIAYELNIHENTVKVHVRNIMRKLQARNRTEVAFKLNTWLQQNRKRDLS